MRRVRSASERLSGVEPYDPTYLPAQAFLSANENPENIPAPLRTAIAARVDSFAFNRYPDPQADTLRTMIAEANGLAQGNVLVGNGGDELLFNLFLAWGGPGRRILTVPPTFSVYSGNAHITGTDVISIPRRADFSIDEQAVIERLARGDIDIVVISSPNNPTGELAREEFLLRVLDSTDALVLVDEAYFEFARQSMLTHLTDHENLVILRTFSKAYSLAGIRLGYLFAHETVVCEFLKVRQPYSVDAFSQLVGEVVFADRTLFDDGIDTIIEQRGVLIEALKRIDGIKVFPSDANYILFRIMGASGANAHQVWQRLYHEDSILIRDFSGAPLLEDCLRVSVGSIAENARFIEALQRIMDENTGGREDPGGRAGEKDQRKG